MGGELNLVIGPMYSGKSTELLRIYNKFKRNYDKLINIWGSDHIGYIPRMKSLLMFL